MLSRALGVATALLVMSFATVPAQAQNLDSGKAPSQIFAGSCAACHKSPRGLLKTVAPGSLPGFLRQHYTTGPDMASMLSAYVISNGAADPRGGGGLTRQGQDLVAPRRPADARPGAAPAAAAPQPEESTGFFSFGRKPAEPPQEAARPDEAPMTARQKRAADRAAKRAADRAAPASAPAVAPEPPRPAVLGEPPVPIETAPMRPSKQKAAKKGRRGQEEPKPAVAEPKSEPVTRPAEETKPEPRPEPAHSEPKPERRPEPRSDPAEAAPLRTDPVPPVTPAPRAEPETRPAPAAESSTTAPAPSAATPTPSPAAPAAE